MLTIRDHEVRVLARAVMKSRGAENMTAAIKLALRNEIQRAEDAVPLLERVRVMVEQAKAKAVRPPEQDAPDARDTLWDR